MNTVKIEIELTEKKALAFAQFLKRVGLEDFRQFALADDEEEELYLMQSAASDLREAFKNSGFAPR